MTRMRFPRSLAVLTLVIALASSTASVLEADTLSISGPFHMDQLKGTVGADLAEVFAHDNENTWSLTLFGITQSNEYIEYNGGDAEELITQVHATSFDFGFVGPDADVLNEVISQQLFRSSLGGELFLELSNLYNYTDFWPGNSLWDFGLLPLDDAAGVSFFARGNKAYSASPYSNGGAWFPAEGGGEGYPLIEPQTITSEKTSIHDSRSGSTGELVSTIDFVDIEGPILSLPGDFNDDSRVDGFDFLKWQRGESSDPLSTSDLADWEAHFGAPTLLSIASTIVPEPTSLVLLALGLPFLVWRHSRRSGTGRIRGATASLPPPFTVNRAFLPADNTLDFIMHNSGDPTGLRVNNIQVTATVTVPEPSSHGESVRLAGLVLTVITSWCCFAGAKNPVFADANPLPRIVVNNGELQNADSGQVFTPRGFNYIRLNAEGWHNTFEPGAYDSARAESMFADLASSGFNTTRVFIDQTIGPGSVASFEATELSPVYMANFFDFLERARNHEIYVAPTFAYWVGSAKYATIRDATPPAFSGTIENVNQLIVDSGHVAAKAQWMADFASAIASHDPALNSTILSYQIDNEANLVDNFAPFNQTSGTILGPGGTIYDLSTDTGKQSLADDAAVLASNTIAEAIKLVDPDALVSTGLFTNHAVGRPGFGNLSTHTTDDTRFPLRPLALLESDLSYLDLHLYPGPGHTLQQDLDSMEWGQVKALAAALGVPITMGEYGTSKFDYPDINDAMNVLTQHLDAVEAEGFKGSVMWTYVTLTSSRISGMLRNRTAISSTC